MVRNPSAMQETWVGKIPWRRERLATPVFWPGEFHRQRSLVGYSPWGRKELDTMERLSTAHVAFSPLDSATLPLFLTGAELY